MRPGSDPALAARRHSRCGGSPAPAQNEQFIPDARLPHRPLRAERHRPSPTAMPTTADAERRATAASTASSSTTRNARPTTTPRAASSATSASRARSRPARRCSIRSPPASPIALIRQGRRRQDPAHHHRLRPHRARRRPRVPVDLPAARHLLDARPTALIKYIGEQGRRHRQAQGQEDRARLSRLAPTARSRSRCCRSARKMHGFELQAHRR